MSWYYKYRKCLFLSMFRKRLKGIIMTELEEDIKHCEEVLANWHGCDECKADHERLLSYMKELLEYRKAKELDEYTLKERLKNALKS